MDNKSVIIFTNFWDANYLIENRVLLFSDNSTKKSYRIIFNEKDINYSVYSIALSSPDLKKQKHLKDMCRIDSLCPTYDLLKGYKKDKDWGSYQKKYINIIKKRKETIKNWVKSLIPNRTYFLCCWENTSHGAHCHREILYDIFRKSATLSNKILCVYRSGANEKSNSKSNSPYIGVDMGINDSGYAFYNYSVRVSPHYDTRRNRIQTEPNIDYNRNSITATNAVNRYDIVGVNSDDAVNFAENVVENNSTIQNNRNDNAVIGRRHYNIDHNPETDDSNS